MLIKVKAAKGRVVKDAPKGGNLIPDNKWVPVRDNRWVLSRIEVGDLLKWQESKPETNKPEKVAK